MKNKKRNITMIAVLLFVCAAVLLNWSYNNRWGEPDAEMVSAEDEAMAQANALSGGEESVAASYFAEARLTRQVSRDEALQLLQTAATAETATALPIRLRSSSCRSSSRSSCSQRGQVPLHSPLWVHSLVTYGMSFSSAIFLRISFRILHFFFPNTWHPS